MKKIILLSVVGCFYLTSSNMCIQAGASAYPGDDVVTRYESQLNTIIANLEAKVNTLSDKINTLNTTLAKLEVQLGSLDKLDTKLDKLTTDKDITRDITEIRTMLSRFNTDNLVRVAAQMETVLQRIEKENSGAITINQSTAVSEVPYTPPGYYMPPAVVPSAMYPAPSVAGSAGRVIGGVAAGILGL